jgi:hypothetical protein
MQGGHPETFYVGRKYKLRMMENGREVTYFDCRVLTVEMPVVKYDHAGSSRVDRQCQLARIYQRRANRLGAAKLGAHGARKPVQRVAGQPLPQARPKPE